MFVADTPREGPGPGCIICFRADSIFGPITPSELMSNNKLTMLLLTYSYETEILNKNIFVLIGVFIGVSCPISMI